MTNNLNDQIIEVPDGDGVNKITDSEHMTLAPYSNVYINRAMLDKWQKRYDSGGQNALYQVIFNDLKTNFDLQIPPNEDDYFNLVATALVEQFSKLKSLPWQLYGVNAHVYVNIHNFNTREIQTVISQQSPIANNKNLLIEERFLTEPNKWTIYLSRYQWQKIMECAGNQEKIIAILSTFPAVFSFDMLVYSEKEEPFEGKVTHNDLATLAAVITNNYEDLKCKFKFNAKRQAGWIIRTDVKQSFCLIDEQKENK